MAPSHVISFFVSISLKTHFLCLAIPLLPQNSCHVPARASAAAAAAAAAGTRIRAEPRWIRWSEGRGGSAVQTIQCTYWSEKSECIGGFPSVYYRERSCDGARTKVGLISSFFEFRAFIRFRNSSSFRRVSTCQRLGRKRR